MKQKFCETCGKEFENSNCFIKHCSVECYRNKKKKEPLFKKEVVDNRQKNQKREVSDLVKSRVHKRDGGRCIICYKVTCDHFHHVKYGNEAVYGSGRNNTDQIVLLCHDCHHKIHHTGETNTLREFCKEYLSKYYAGK